MKEKKKIGVGYDVVSDDEEEEEDGEEEEDEEEVLPTTRRVKPSLKIQQSRFANILKVRASASAAARDEEPSMDEGKKRNSPVESKGNGGRGRKGAANVEDEDEEDASSLGDKVSGFVLPHQLHGVQTPKFVIQFSLCSEHKHFLTLVTALPLLDFSPLGLSSVQSSDSSIPPILNLFCQTAGTIQNPVCIYGPLDRPWVREGQLTKFLHATYGPTFEIIKSCGRKQRNVSDSFRAVWMVDLLAIYRKLLVCLLVWGHSTSSRTQLS